MWYTLFIDFTSAVIFSLTFTRNRLLKLDTVIDYFRQTKSIDIPSLYVSNRQLMRTNLSVKVIGGFTPIEETKQSKRIERQIVCTKQKRQRSNDAAPDGTADYSRSE